MSDGNIKSTKGIFALLAKCRTTPIRGRLSESSVICKPSWEGMRELLFLNESQHAFNIAKLANLGEGRPSETAQFVQLRTFVARTLFLAWRRRFGDSHCGKEPGPPLGRQKIEHAQGRKGARHRLAIDDYRLDRV